MELIENFILTYGYISLIPLAILEGPIVTIIGGFFVSLHLLNPFLVYVIIIIGDIIGDTFYYLLGRFGRRHFLKWVGPKLGVNEESLEKVRGYFHTKGHKTIMLAKLIQGIGVSGLVVAGSAKVPYLKYISMCFVVTAIQAFAFLLIGIFFGHAYATLNQYLHYFASATIVVGLSALVLFIVHRMKISRA